MTRSLILAAVLLAALAASPAEALAQAEAVTPAQVATIQRDMQISTVGPQQADVVIVEYLDYNCPFCKRMHPELQALQRADHRVRLIYKDWPIFGEISSYAAQAALAAGYQGKYAAAHDALIGHPTRLDSQAAVRRVLAAAGVDLSRLDKSLQDKRAQITAQLDRNAREARGLGLEGTPGFLINDRLVPGGMPMAALQAIVSQARAKPEASRATR